MADKPEDITPSRPSSPLIFISHDSRDAEIAEAFSKLLKSVSAGMLKSFRSSDKKGTEGIVFGDEWYKSIMTKLSEASDVVCLLTENSIERPWILYEAGVAKGKSSIPVHGLALGIPLSKTSSGPFYQFQNCDDSDEAIIKLTNQLCSRVPGLAPDESVVKSQVVAFKETIAPYCRRKSTTTTEEISENCEKEQSLAKILEEIKATLRELPALVSSPKIIHSALKDDKFSLTQIKSKNRILHRIQDTITKDESTMLLIIPSLISDTYPFIANTCTAIWYMIYEKKFETAKSLADSLRWLIEITLHETMGSINSEREMRQFDATREILACIATLLRDIHYTPISPTKTDNN